MSAEGLGIKGDSDTKVERAALLAVSGCWMLLIGVGGFYLSAFVFSPWVMLAILPSFMLSGIALYYGWLEPVVAAWITGVAIWCPSVLFLLVRGFGGPVGFIAVVIAALGAVIVAGGYWIRCLTRTMGREAA
ncbi:hypothetical protein [Streptomyces triculaminicus]|uniref:hypothetical protein n=1 Tax=Streptomyces triculaminicus TaxID=2816232 RepID=UPI00379C60A3